MIPCVKCGWKNEAGGAFCARCDAAIAQEPPIHMPVVQPVPQPAAAPKQQAGGKKTKVIVVAVIATLVAAVAAFIFILF